MEKWFIKSFKQRKTNFMVFLRKRIGPEQIIQRNWSYKIQVFKIAAKAEKDKTQKPGMAFCLLIICLLLSFIIKRKIEK